MWDDDNREILGVIYIKVVILKLFCKFKGFLLCEDKGKFCYFGGSWIFVLMLVVVFYI